MARRGSYAWCQRAPSAWCQRAPSAWCQRAPSAWCQRAPRPTEPANQQWTEPIKTVFEERDQTYGRPRLYAALKQQQGACSKKRVARLRRLCDLSAVLPKRFVATTESNHALPVAQNLLDRQLGADTPHTRWSADIAYVWTAEGRLYLGVVVDLFSRRVVGWAMGTSLERSLVISALSMAIQNRHPDAGLLCMQVCSAIGMGAVNRPVTMISRRSKMPGSSVA